MKITVKNLKRVIKEAIEMSELDQSDSEDIQVGDLVDVDLEYEGVQKKIRVERMIPDVNQKFSDSRLEAEIEPYNFHGPGFIGISEDESGSDWNKGARGIFSLLQVVPGSKLKYFFPEEDQR